MLYEDLPPTKTGTGAPTPDVQSNNSPNITQSPLKRTTSSETTSTPNNASNPNTSPKTIHLPLMAAKDSIYKNFIIFVI